MITNKTYSFFLVSIEGRGGHFSQEGYSKYSERWNMNNKGTLPKGEEIYGYQQALEHIEELKNSVYEGKKHYADKQFQIQIETRTVTTVNV